MSVGLGDLCCRRRDPLTCALSRETNTGLGGIAFWHLEWALSSSSPMLDCGLCNRDLQLICYTVSKKATHTASGALTRTVRLRILGEAYLFDLQPCLLAFYSWLIKSCVNTYDWTVTESEKLCSPALPCWVLLHQSYVLNEPLHDSSHLGQPPEPSQLLAQKTSHEADLQRSRSHHSLSLA